MYSRPNAKMIATIKDAAKKLKGEARRSFEAQVTLDHCYGSVRFAKTLFGWKPETIQKGLAEKESGLVIVAHRSTGRISALRLHPSLENDIRAIVDPASQANVTVYFILRAKTQRVKRTSFSHPVIHLWDSTTKNTKYHEKY